MGEQDDFDNMVLCVSDKWEKLAKGKGICVLCSAHGEVAHILHLKVCITCFFECHKERYEVIARSESEYDMPRDYEEPDDRAQYVPADAVWTYDDEYTPEDYDLPDDETWFE